MKEQIEEMRKDLIEIFEEEYENRRLITPQNTAEKMTAKGYRKQTEGKWKKRGNEKTCSLCKFIYYSNNDEWNFCPNCGAKMKGE